MFNKIISPKNIIAAWGEFLRGKRKKADVQVFSLKLIDSIFALHTELVNKTYVHGSYAMFKISDPKPRIIHKAKIKDRLLHHAVYRILYPLFDRKFISDSFSCRDDKGTHKALYRFEKFTHIVSQNNTRQCWVLKCDIKKFFANINHKALLIILVKHISDKNTLWLCKQIIRSFETQRGTGKGLPLGNLTSQLFANVYMNELDQYVKHVLKTKHYIRYADDFVFLSNNKEELEHTIPVIQKFLKENLKLSLHEDKLFIKAIGSGVDFLGWTHFPDHRVLRTATKKRMLKRIQNSPTYETLNSYLGLLKHGNAHTLQQKVLRVRSE